MKVEIRKWRVAIYGLALAVSVAFVSFYGGPLPYVLLHALFLLLPASIVYTIINYMNLKVYQEIDTVKVTKGELHNYRATIENAFIFPVYKLGIYLYEDRCIMESLTGDLVYSLNSKEKIELKSEIKCKYAGAYDIGIEKISLEDPFGIYKVILDVPYKFRAVVSPQITDMASKAIEIENIFNNRGLSSDNLVQEIPGSDIRPYVPGDSFHSINWKVSAKVGDIMVRIPDNMERQTVTMLLLADEKEEDKYTITALKRRDYFLEFIVSAAWYFASEDMPVKFIYPAGRISQFTVDSKRSFSEFYSIVADGIFYNSPGVYKDLKNTLNNQGKGVYGEDTWIVVTENPKENEEFCRIY